MHLFDVIHIRFFGEGDSADNVLFLVLMQA